MCKEQKYDIAISYTHSDSTYVRDLYIALTRRGCSTFVDVEQHDNLVGRFLHEILYDVFYNRAAYSVLIINKEYLEHAHTMWEAKSVISRSVYFPNRFIVVLTDNVSRQKVCEKLCINCNYLFVESKNTSTEKLADLIIARKKELTHEYN